MSNSEPFDQRHFVLGLNEATLGLFAAAVILMGAVFWSAHSPNVEKTDFSLTYVGARIVHQGGGSRLYDLSFQKQVRDSLFEHPNPLFYEHPPFEALILSPLSVFPFRTSYMLWGLLNAAVWLALMFVLRPFLPWPREDLGYLCLWFLFAPVGVALFQGQSSIFVLGSYALVFIELQQDRQLTAGFWLGLGLLKLQFILPFAFIFLVRRKWRFLLGFTVSSCLVLVLSIIAVGWNGIVGYIRLLSDVNNNPQNLSYGSATDMPTIYGFIHAILGREIPPRGLNLIVACLSLALLALVGRKWQSVANCKSNELMFAAAIANSLLAGSHMFTHDFSPLLLALFVAGANFPQQQYRGLRFALGATMVLFWTFAIYFLCVAWHCLFLMSPILLLFAFSVMLAAQYTRQQPMTRGQPVAG
jgi:Glycosyltransferase family 87